MRYINIKIMSIISITIGSRIKAFINTKRIKRKSYIMSIIRENIISHRAKMFDEKKTTLYIAMK